jgi:hypothetical protein
MIDSNSKPAEQPANLVSLQRELADLATRTKQADRAFQDRVQQVQGPILVIRGK